jgi:hypothetical protein
LNRTVNPATVYQEIIYRQWVLDRVAVSVLTVNRKVGVQIPTGAEICFAITAPSAPPILMSKGDPCNLDRRVIWTNALFAYYARTCLLESCCLAL